MDEAEKLRMNLVAIQKVDPYAKVILDSCPHVAFYKYIDNQWEKSEIEGSFFVYSRVAEPFYSIFINNRLNTNSLVEPITKPIELQSQPPFLLYRNQRSAISGFWFYCEEDCKRIHGVLEKLIKKASTNNIANHNSKATDSVMHQHPQHQPLPHQTNLHNLNLNGNDKKPDVDIFTMLTKAQAEFRNSNVAPPSAAGAASSNAIEQKFVEMQISQPVQPTTTTTTIHQPLMKQLSNAMPDITSPNVVSFFAAAQQPNGVPVAVVDKNQQKVSPLIPYHPIIHQQKASPLIPYHPNVQPPVQTLDEIEKQHRVSSISPKIESKVFNNILQSAAANQQTQPSSSPKPVMLLKQQGSSQVQPQLQQPSKPTLITPNMFHATGGIEDKAILGIQANATLSSNISSSFRPEPLTQSQLIQALNYLIENDPEFIRKIHEAYVKSFNKMLPL